MTHAIPLFGVLLMVVATVGLGIWATRRARTASDFFVAGRSVGIFSNASAISGEYLSAASFMGVAALIMKNGYDALWYPVCYAAGYLFLLLFIAGPLRRFGAYTIPDFAEGRFDSPLFRRIAVTFVLFIGFFYTMPQMKGAGVTMNQILNWPYWVGIVVVGAIITFNVAIGGMKGITFVQAFQYWAKMFAIAAPIFIIMAYVGGYNQNVAAAAENARDFPRFESNTAPLLVSGISKAPLNVVAFGPGVTTFTLPHGAKLHAVGPRRKPMPGEDPIYPDMLLSPPPGPATPDAPAGSFPPGAVVQAQTHRVTRDNNVFVVAGASEKTTARIELQEPAEFVFQAGDAIPNAPTNRTWVQPFGTLTDKWGYPLLYTYSLILALVCGTAGLPHILVRFYTNPNGRAAKRTTLWVMVLIGTFYLFPAVWGSVGRAVDPVLYANSKTESLVIALPNVLSNKLLASILSGITSAGAFAAFMSTFSGLLVSMAGALAHDIYGRILHPASTPEQRLAAFKLSAIILGAGAMGLGMLVEPFDIAVMVNWAFAIGAASYFPLLLLGSWWRGLTKYGAALGMLSGGLLSVGAIVVHMLIETKVLSVHFSPLVRNLLEQPAIWAVPLSFAVMYLVSNATQGHVPGDVHLKMLRLHAPEEMGVGRDYVKE